MPDAKEAPKIPPGMVALTSHGSIRIETAMSLLESCRAVEKAGATVAFVSFGGGLVDKSRNDACRCMMENGHAYLLFIDGDMVFKPDAVLKILTTAYVTAPWADIVGGWCPLRGSSVPTIDTGTGTWESHFPNSGVKEVIRTGAAFVLVKRHVIEKMPYPWYGVRHPNRLLDSMLELDNWSRTQFNGANVFRSLPQWDQLLVKASTDANAKQAAAGYEVGEDSGFCDRAKALGARIVVDTDIEIGHVDVKVLTGDTHKEFIDNREAELWQAHGVMIHV